MEPFPEDWEWLWVMEAEPVHSEQVFIKFDTQIEDSRIQLDVWPFDTEVDLRWWRNDEINGDLQLRWVAGIAVETGPKVSALHLTFEQDCLLPLRFQIRPHITIDWGTKWLSP